MNLSNVLCAYPHIQGLDQNMTRSKYFYLAIVIFSVGTAGAFILPLGSAICPQSNCRAAVSQNWDFSVAPERKLTMFPSPEGLSTIPAH
jgi:hypothetical protein